TMSAILTKDPVDLDLDKLAIPPALDRIIRRCLEKNAELRFQSATDLAFALENMTTASGVASASTIGAAPVAAPATAPAGRRSLLPWVIAGLMAVAAAAGWWPRGAATSTASRF